MPRLRQLKPTPELLQSLPFSVTQPLVWSGITYPGDAWLVAYARRLGERQYQWIPQEVFDGAREAAAATDWRTESGAVIVFTMATAESVRRAIRRFGSVPLPDDGSRDEAPEFAVRAEYFFLRILELELVIDADAEVPPRTGEATVLLLGQLAYTFHAYAGAKAESARRRDEHPEILAAWTVLSLRHPENAKLAAETDGAAQLAVFGDLFAGRGEKGRKLLGRMFKRHLAEAHGVPATRQGLEGLLWSEFLETLRREWDHATFSDYAVIAAALDGDLKMLHWAMYDDLVDAAKHEEARPAVESPLRLPLRPGKPTPVDCPRCGQPGAVPPYVCPRCGLGVPEGA